MRDPNPVVVLVPGVGRMTFAGDKTTARLAGEFYGNAINVMRGAEASGQYVGLPENEAYGIEYWALEDAKLQRMPKPKPLAGRTSLITGAAGGIGTATADRLCADGACVMLVDLDAERLNTAAERLAQAHGRATHGQRCSLRHSYPRILVPMDDVEEIAFCHNSGG